MHYCEVKVKLITLSLVFFIWRTVYFQRAGLKSTKNKGVLLSVVQATFLVSKINSGIS